MLQGAGLGDIKVETLRTPLLFLAAMLVAAQANAAGYGPYSAETYRTCGSPTAPVAVEIIHGGAWASGNSGSDTSQTQQLCQYLGANGIYAVSIDYRLSTTMSWPAQLQDAQLGLRWVHALSTAKRVGVIGTSAGGHIALSMGEA